MCVCGCEGCSITTIIYTVGTKIVKSAVIHVHIHFDFTLHPRDIPVHADTLYLPTVYEVVNANFIYHCDRTLLL